MKEFFSGHLNAMVMAASVLIAVLLPFAVSRIDSKVLRGVGKGMEAVLRNIVGSIMIVVIFVVMGMGIFFRYALRSPLLWTNELVLALYVGLAFFMSATNIYDHQEVSMDFVLGRLREKTRHILQWAFDYIEFSLCIYIFYFSIQYTKRIKGLGLTFDTLWNIPWWTLYAVAPIGFFCASVFMCLRISNHLKTAGSQTEEKGAEKGDAV